MYNHDLQKTIKLCPKFELILYKQTIILTYVMCASTLPPMATFHFAGEEQQRSVVRYPPASHLYAINKAQMLISEKFGAIF